MTALKHLFSPVTIGPLKVKNRILMSAMSINFGVDDNGFVTDQLTQYFVARAKGGAGMMLVGGGGVHPDGVELPGLPALWDDACIPALKTMVAAVAPYDCRFGMQIMHGGRQSYHDHKVAPSAIPAPALAKGTPRELTPDEIVATIASYGNAARRVRDAGFDFVEVHGAHGYLINQFLAPNSNQRTDQWGGSFENRIRFMLEVLRDIRKKCGADFPVGIRMNGEDYIEDGWGLEEALKLAPILETEGATYLHVSAGVYGSRQLTIPSMYVPHGCFIHLAEAVKKVVSIPVIGVGRVKHADLGDRFIREGKCDVMAMGRALIADPELPNKAAADALPTVRPCIGCCLGCIHAVFQLEPGGCVVNPAVGREYLLAATGIADPARTVLVIGAGPAGMGAARMAALRGHRVVLCEESAHVGGLLRLAAVPPGRAEVGDIIAWLNRELGRLNVEVRLNTPVTDALLDAIDPAVVILATGSMPEMPIITGLFKTDMDLCTVTEVLDGKITGDRVLVIGGGQAGLLAADFLAEKGKDVVVLNRKRHFAEEMSANDRFYLRERLKRATVRLFKGVSINRVYGDAVEFTVSGDTVTLDGFDTVVVAEAMASVREASRLLKKRDVIIHIIGDAKTPRNLMLGLAEADEIAREI
ncbi:MAG: FAD-dependent oxidoreductase [Pseudomonadota bacterium]